MPRQVLTEDKIHPGARDKVASNHADIVREVQDAIGNHDVVVVGMAQNPHVKRARKVLGQKGIRFHYLEYGSYTSLWRRRNALKMWTGWPTFPMVFHKGVLVGGANEVTALVQRGEIA